MHATTVSLALRNSPTLPPTTRERIQRLAEEMGYRPDPMLTALQAYRKASRETPVRSVIAWLNAHNPPASLYHGEHVRLAFQGATRRCETLGYRLEEFSLAETSSKRLHQILQARGIQGILVPPQARNRAHLSLPWQHYSAVSFGYTLTRPRLHMVTNAQYDAVRVAMRRLWSHGYRRIGFITTPATDVRTDQNFTAAYLAAQQRFAATPQVPVLYFTDDDYDQNFATFQAWYAQQRPEAIVSFLPEAVEFMGKLGIGFEECGYAMIHMGAEGRKRGMAGIDPNDTMVGSSAVDLLVSMLHRNERGVPEIASKVLIAGRWIEGLSVPRWADGKTAAEHGAVAAA